MDLSIIVVNWNSRDYLRRCLASIRAHSPTVETEIIVIDSASYDGSEGMVRDAFPAVRFIQSSLNLGFARANNRAFEASLGACVLFLNPDTEVSPGAIDALYATVVSDGRVGVVGPTLLNSNGSVQTTCVRAIPTIANRMLDSNLLRSAWPTCPLWGAAALYTRASGAAEVEAISGACMMVRRTTFEEVGRFSEDYFMYAEDMDLCDKIRRAGYRNVYVPESRVVHHGGSSSQQAENRFAAVMMPEATWRFFGKSRGAAYALVYRGAMFVSAVGRLAALHAALLVQRDADARRLQAASIRKWWAVARWCLNQDETVKRYYSSSSSDRALTRKPAHER